MKKDHLKKFVKQIIRENLNDREYKRILNEVSPPGKKSERMIQHVKTSLRKSHPDWNEDKITSVAIATGWKAHNKKDVEESDKHGDFPPERPKFGDVDYDTDEAGLTSEMGPDSKITPLDDITRLVINRGVTDPEQVAYLVGNLYAHQIGTSPDPKAVEAAIERNKPMTKSGGSGVLNFGPLEETSYKVVSPNETDTADEDKARTIQTDPKVNETAYKTQGPSYKTFEDSPQLPDAANDPENA